MKKQVLLLLSIALISIKGLHAQSAVEPEKWIEKPVVNKINSKYQHESAVVLFDKRKVEYADESKSVVEYYTLHKIIHINDDRGIESFNKVYLGVSENADIIQIKGRTILPGGKIIEIDKRNIKDVKEDDGNTYKIFALEGVEKGCDVEYYYTFKRGVSFFGREVMQNKIPVLESIFEITAPERLKFDVKTYNFIAVPTDTVINKVRNIRCMFTETAGADEEKYASYLANLRRVEFKLSYNDAISKGERIYTWNELARRIFGIYSYYTDKDIKKVAEIVSDKGWDRLSNEVEKITAVENYIKKNYTYQEKLITPEGNLLSTVLKEKIGGAIGTLRLYSAMLQNLKVNFQFVLTSDRGKAIIDKTFENWNNCDEPVLYFPGEGKYLAPTRVDYRYPWIVPLWGSANGLFCKQTTLGSMSTALGDVKSINLEEYPKSVDNIEAKLELSKGLDSLTLDDRQIFTGYSAIGLRDAFNYSNNEQKNNIIKELAKSFASTDHILFSEVLNPEFEKATNNEPLILHVKTKSSELVERAGNKLLLKIGMAIGPQVEMYQEKPRQEPIYMGFGHVEERKIDFVIPEGYIISNLDDLKINQTFSDNGELTMGFVSNYEIKGNILSVHILEQYRKTSYPLNQFDQFRKIINASSDFNKIVLVLEKKS